MLLPLCSKFLSQVSRSGHPTYLDNTSVLLVAGETWLRMFSLAAHRSCSTMSLCQLTHLAPTLPPTNKSHVLLLCPLIAHTCVITQSPGHRAFSWFLHVWPIRILCKGTMDGPIYLPKKNRCWPCCWLKAGRALSSKNCHALNHPQATWRKNKYTDIQSNDSRKDKWGSTWGNLEQWEYTKFRGWLTERIELQPTQKKGQWSGTPLKVEFRAQTKPSKLIHILH